MLSDIVASIHGVYKRNTGNSNIFASVYKALVWSP